MLTFGKRINQGEAPGRIIHASQVGSLMLVREEVPLVREFPFTQVR